MAFVEFAGGCRAVESHSLEIIFCRGMEAIHEFFEFGFHFFGSVFARLSYAQIRVSYRTSRVVRDP